MADPIDTTYQLRQQGTSPMQIKSNSVGSNVAASQQRVASLHDQASQSSMSSLAKARNYLNKTMGKTQDAPDPVPGIQST